MHITKIILFIFSIALLCSFMSSPSASKLLAAAENLSLTHSEVSIKDLIAQDPVGHRTTQISNSLTYKNSTLGIQMNYFPDWRIMTNVSGLYKGQYVVEFSPLDDPTSSLSISMIPDVNSTQLYFYAY